MPSGLSLPVSLIVYGPPGATIPDIEPVQVRVDVAGPGPILTGSVAFRNVGTAPATGVVVSEAPWLIPANDPVQIAANQAATIGFTINRAFRTEPESVDSLLTTVRFVYPPQTRAGGRSTNSAGEDTQPGTQTSDSPDLAAVVTPLPDIAAGQIGLTIPGIRSLTIPSGRILTDLLVSSTAADPALGLYLLEKDSPSNGALRASNATNVTASGPLLLANVVDKGFNKPSATGSLHFRSSVSSRLSVDALIQVLDNARQLLFFRDSPSARSDRGAATGATLYLPGVESFQTASAVVYVQEVAGTATEFEIQILSASGVVLQSMPRRAIQRFQMVEQQISLLGGAAAVTVRNTGAAGRITALCEEAAGAALDARSLWDPASIYGNTRTEVMVIPYSASTGATPAPPDRRRPVRRSGGGAKTLPVVSTATATTLAIFSPAGARVELELRTATRSAKQTVELSAGQTKSYDDAFAELFASTSAESGAIVLRPISGEFVAAAWLVEAGAAGEPVVLSLPVLPVTSAFGTTTKKTFLRVSDSSATSIASIVATAVTPAVGVVETSGNAVTIDVVVTYAVDRTTAGPKGTRRYSLAANQVLHIDDVVRAVIGATREAAPDLFNVTVSVEVVSGSGKVIPFIVTRALRSGDRTIRVR